MDSIRRCSLLAALSFLVCACGGAPGASDANPVAPLSLIAESASAPTLNDHGAFRDSFDFVDTNWCTGEDVHLVGTNYIVWQTLENGGHQTSVFQWSFQGSGLGLTSGRRYVITGTSRGTTTTTTPEGMDNLTNHYYLRAQGAGGDIWIRLTYHVTYNGNGEFVFERTSFVVGCS